MIHIPNKRLKVEIGCDTSSWQRCSVYLAAAYRNEESKFICKIGFSTNGGESRTYSVRSRKEPFEFIGEVKCCCRRHARELERDLHMFLRSRHLDHERFLLDNHEFLLVSRVIQLLSDCADKREETKKNCKTMGDVRRLEEDPSPRFDLFGAIAGASKSIMEMSR